MTSKQIRQDFLDFFRGKGHAIVPSSPVVPFDDPTLMFTNAGMNQFKDVFLGTGSRAYKRAANTQKCIRAGGKHNDLDDVGQDTYHHTFFEMLGNWSFGDYFKKEAIAWAWELLTKVWGIDKSRLHATYFGGQRKATEPRSHGATKDNPSRDRNGAEQSEPGAQATGGPDRQSTIDNRQFPDEWELEPDYEARDLWASVTDIDPTHIHPGNMKDNFWEMGETGPCGPCSEIHIDLTPDKSGSHLVNKGDARVMEIWNLVFIQFNRGSDGKLTPLPAKHVDTGMGFERLCAVLQGTKQGRIGRVSNYDTDVFTPIFAAIQKRTAAPNYRGTLPNQNRDSHGAESVGRVIDPTKQSRDREGAGLVTHEGTEAQRHDEITKSPNHEITKSDDQILVDVSYRVIADHVRCLTFALTDGAIPSNEGRGYVLRRILRRAVRYGRQYLNMHEPFLCDLVAPLVEHMAEAFPELRTAHRGKNVEHVTALIRDEEASFLKTLDRGMRLFEEAAEVALIDATGGWIASTPERQPIIPGNVAFRLHDTFGFPIDLTLLMAQERGMGVDVANYERLMEQARERARAGSNKFDAVASIFDKQEATDDSPKYTTLETTAQIIMVATDNDQASAEVSLKVEDDAQILLDRTCFYGEQGGQVGDVGFIEGEGFRFRVHHTLHGGYWVNHFVELVSGEFKYSLGGPPVVVKARVDRGRRYPTMQNHTATHVLNWALREVLEIEGGGKVDQKGSLVDPEKTRFDFSHTKPLTDDELDRIEKLCNGRITAKLPVYAANREEDFVDQKMAREINTLRAVFGEKYPDKVRVVSIGVPITEEDAKRAKEMASSLPSRAREEADSATPLNPPLSRGEAIETDWLLRDPQNPKWMNYSVEFCGGTHVANTSEIGSFVLTHEEGVAKGVRRVVGISGEKAKQAETLGAELLAAVQRSRFKVQDQNRDSHGAVHPSRDREAEGDQGGSPKVTAGYEGTKARRHVGRPPLSPLDKGGGFDAAGVADFQKRLAEAAIPIRVRREIQTILAEVQKALKEQSKESAAASGEAAMDAVAALLKSAETIGGVTVVVGEVPPAGPEALRGAIDWVRNKTTASAVLLGCVEKAPPLERGGQGGVGGKVTLIAGMSKAVVDRGIKAGDLIKEICPLVGGKGGGRPDMAQGGGADPGGLESALQRGREWIAGRLA
ncbi:MAG: alanine--tRNA ligase [Planctomycetota bacterium]